MEKMKLVFLIIIKFNRGNKEDGNVNVNIVRDDIDGDKNNVKYKIWYFW